jgi:hypothetical protein
MCPYSKQVLDSNHDFDEQKWYFSLIESHITRKKHDCYKVSTPSLGIPRGLFYRRNIYNSPFFTIMEQFSSGKVMSLLGTIAVVSAPRLKDWRALHPLFLVFTHHYLHGIFLEETRVGYAEKDYF